MTVVVGLETKEGAYIVADTQGSSGWDASMRADSKVFISNGIGYGFTSSYRMGQILRYHTYEVLSGLREEDLFGYVVTCLVPMYRRILDDHGYMQTKSGAEVSGTFIIAIDGKIFTIDDDFQVAQQQGKYWSVGCGYAYALGSLATLESTKDELVYEDAKLAIETAKTFSNGCGGPVDHVFIEKKGE